MPCKYCHKPKPPKPKVTCGDVFPCREAPCPCSFSTRLPLKCPYGGVHISTRQAGPGLNNGLVSLVVQR